jgi:CheY-like chemotaxis protein
MAATRKTILLVDDSQTSIFVERMILKARPYDLLVARDGEEAVRTAESHRPDLILMDVVMPRMNGFQAVEEIRKLESIRDVPIIMVSTRGEAGNVETGFEQGCNDYVTKPVDATELLTKVDNLIGA